ncbi:DNA polymerase III subunit delta' [Ferrimonas senticii]|uniref:DNA polymerase III subunit delta' n=1 Tax=Ferrimonas senticii TaxID=394566 RepID=UPI000420934F|nr:DNA polymerase III subunit delta' [Ferrimonas senticii]
MTTLPQWLTEPWQQWLARRSSGRLGHGLLIQGAVGVGKGLLAEQITQALLCQQPSVAGGCGHCKSCLLLNSGHHPDRIDIEPDGNQIKVEQIRALITALESTAHQGGGRVVILHQVERLNGAAANALLKTLEEPMPGVHLVLLTAMPQQLLPTIVSRCQRLLVALPTWQQSCAYLDQSLGNHDGDSAQQLGDWPYWQALLGGPLALTQWLQQGNGAEQIVNWRKLWRQSLKSGVLEQSLAAVDSEQAPLVVKVLYYELLYIGRKRPQWLASHYASLQQISEKITWLQRQSGINLVAIMQQMVTELRSKG